MTHHQFGAIAGDEDTGGTFSAGDGILIREHATVAVDTIRQGEALPMVALELSGRVNKSDDTVQTVWFLSVLDAGQIAGALLNAVKRLGSDELLRDFAVGVSLGNPEQGGQQ